MTELPEFLRRFLKEDEAPTPGEDTPKEVEDTPQEIAAAREIVEGPTLAALVESDAPLPAVRSPREKLGELTGQALDKLAEVLKLSREQVLALSEKEFERLIPWAKIQLSATEVIMRTQLKADEGVLKAKAIDQWPKLLERWEAAKLEAARLRESIAAEERQARSDLTGSAASEVDGAWRPAVVRSA